MALSPFIDISELDFQQPDLMTFTATEDAAQLLRDTDHQIFDVYGAESTSTEEQDAQNAATALYEGQGQEPDPDDDPADIPGRLHGEVTVEKVRADAAQAEREEPTSKVERLLESVETLTPSVAFRRCHHLLEPRSQSSFTAALYRAEVAIQCRRALESDLMLQHLYTLLYERGGCHGIPHTVLARNHAVQQIWYLCGLRLRKLKLWNYTGWAYRERLNHTELG